MPKERSPNRDKAFEIFKEHNGNIENRRIAEQLDISEKTISGWKCKDKWSLKLNGVLHSKERSTPKKKGGQPANKNATGPPKNKNAETHGFFSKYLPAETFSIIQEIEKKDPLDILWENIQIAYAAIVRAQQIMYVRDKKDKTKEKIEYKDGNVIGEKWEVQQAWDKQATFLKAQARAQSELRGLIKQYDEMLHKNWDLATEEQKVRINVLRAKTQDGEDTEITDDGFLNALSGSAMEDWTDEEE